MAYVSQLGNEDLVSDYIFTSQREPHPLPDGRRGKGGEMSSASNQIFKNEVLDRNSTFTGGLLGKRGWLFQAGFAIFK